MTIGIYVYEYVWLVFHQNDMNWFIKKNPDNAR